MEAPIFPTLFIGMLFGFIIGGFSSQKIWRQVKIVIRTLWSHRLARWIFILLVGVVLCIGWRTIGPRYEFHTTTIHAGEGVSVEKLWRCDRLLGTVKEVAN